MQVKMEFVILTQNIRMSKLLPSLSEYMRKLRRIYWRVDRPESLYAWTYVMTRALARFRDLRFDNSLLS